MNVRTGLHDCVHKIPVVLPLVVPSMLFYEPNHEADVDKCKLAKIILTLIFVIYGKSFFSEYQVY